jgi:WD40 repeat protein
VLLAEEAGHFLRWKNGWRITMQLVCQHCNQPVAVQQTFCGNCGIKLNTGELDEPTERIDGSRPQQPSLRPLPGSPFTYPGGVSVSSENFYTVTLDAQDYAESGSFSTVTLDAKNSSGTRTGTPDPYATLGYNAPEQQISPFQTKVHSPVTTLDGSPPIPQSYSSDALAISQENTHILGPSGSKKGKISRRKVLSTLTGLSILAAAGLGADLVISSQHKASAHARKPASYHSPRPQLNANRIYTYPGHRTPVYGLIWEPKIPSGPDAGHDVFRIASCASNVQLWDAFNGGNPKTYNAYQGEVFSLAWCHSTNKIVSGNFDGTAHIWLASTAQHVNSLVGHSAAIRGVAWARDGIHIATASNDMQVGLWPLDTSHNDAATPAFYQKHGNTVYAVNFSDDSQYLVSSSADRTAMIWRVQNSTLTYLATYAGHHDEVRTVAFAPGSSQSSGYFIASGSQDKTVQIWIWNPADQAILPMAHYAGHNAPVYTLAWSPDGSRIASGDSSGQVHIWQSKTGKALLAFPAHQGAVNSLGWSPEGQYLASAGLDQVVHVYKIA